MITELNNPQSVDYEFLLQDAAIHASLMREGELSSVALTQQVLSAIDQLNPKLNCYFAVDREGALAAAQASDARRQRGEVLSAIDGLTVAVKDNIDVKGLVTTAGLGLPENTPVAQRDSFVVNKLRRAGAIILGKLNLHEAALGATNDNYHHGRCINPHRGGFTPGGSSGGSGAAVAAGLCAFALGTDTMGSVRIPASYCGVSGIKPTRGAVSIGGSRILSRRLDHIGPLARAPGDLSLILPLMAGYDPGCAQSANVLFEQWNPNPAELVIGYADVTQGLGVTESVKSAYTSALARFADAGAQQRRQDLQSLDCASARRAGLMLCEVDLFVDQQPLLREHPEYFSPALRKLIAYGIGKSAVDFASADRRLDKAVVKMAAWLEDCDFLVLPTAPQAAFDFCEPAPAGQADLTNMANMSGHPAISVPMGTDGEGLPLGLQIIGPHGSDLQLIALAQWFAQFMPRPQPNLGLL
ncbi:amidase [uncultured Microbulbifer sp.]|uniref:amidase n=1 Tax=uncultured Microbulbifer sp. TaxID=348147 RepID=UPI002635C8AF|nr:amidase [uncultured Microbulbifer sp.]